VGVLPKLQVIFREILLIMDCISDYSSDILAPPYINPALARTFVFVYHKTFHQISENIILYEYSF